MKRLFALLFVLWCAPALAAGMMQDIVNAKPPASGGGCSQATAFLARTSGLSGPETTAYTNLICGLATDGTLSLFDALYVFATNNTTTAALNLISTNYTATVHGALTFSADHGWTGDSSTGYLDTGFDPATATSPNFTQNSAAVGFYNITNRNTVIADVDIGVAGGGFYTYIKDQGNGGEYDVNGATFLAMAALSNADGLFLATRTSSAVVTLYVNGVFNASSSSDTSGAVANFNIYVFAYNSSGTPTNVSGDQLSAAFIGGALNSGQAASVSSRINAYMTALGINVY